MVGVEPSGGQRRTAISAGSVDEGSSERASTRKGRATRDRIFAAAIRLVADRGYEATTIPAVCAEAGVSTGSFYHHFRSKSDILLAYVREESESLLDYYRTLEGESRRAALLSCVERFFGYYAMKGRNFVASFLSILLLEGGGWFRPESLALEFIVRDCLERGAAAGEFESDSGDRSGLPSGTAVELATGIVWDLSCSWCVEGGPGGLADRAVERFSRFLDFAAGGRAS